MNNNKQTGRIYVAYCKQQHWYFHAKLTPGPKPLGAFWGRAPQITASAPQASIIPRKKITGLVQLECISGAWAP